MTQEIEQCGSCGEPIYRLKHIRTGRPAPIEVRTSSTGDILCDLTHGTYQKALPDEKIIYSERLHLNHFTSCPQAKTWHKVAQREPQHQQPGGGGA